LKEQLGIEADALAYPVGGKSSFTVETQRIANELGYRCAFSHSGGTNNHGNSSAYDVKRTKMVNQSWKRFLAQTVVYRPTGSFWP
jgi:hypothetical protein